MIIDVGHHYRGADQSVRSVRRIDGETITWSGPSLRMYQMPLADFQAWAVQEVVRDAGGQWVPV